VDQLPSSAASEVLKKVNVLDIADTINSLTMAVSLPCMLTG